MPRLFLLLTIAVFVATTAYAEVPVRDLPPGAASPPARITDVSFLEGIWVGQGLGGQTEEAYASPLGGAMVGYFRFVKDNKVVFYEIVTIVETNGTLAMRLKHFHADLKGWEEKDDVQQFKLVAIDGQTVYFDGLSLRRDGDTLYSAVKDKGPQERQHARRTVQLPTEEVACWERGRPARSFRFFVRASAIEML